MSSSKVPRLAIGLATAVGVATAAGILILYWQKKKRQQAIEDRLRGFAGSKKKNEQSARDEKLRSTPANKKEEVVSEEPKDQKTLVKQAAQESGTDESEICTRSNGKKVPKMQERCITFEMTIAREVVGSLIGKGGTNIRKLQKETNTRIAPRGEVLENGDRVYTITGTPEAVSLAENKIRKHIMSLPVITRAEIEVPEHVVGKIIGHQGENIRAIQDQSHARLDIPRDSPIEGNKLFTDDDYEPPKPVDRNVRKIIIKGTEEQIALARKLINNEVEKDATLRARILESTKTRSDRRVPRLPVQSVSPQPGASSSQSSQVNGVSKSPDASAPVVTPIRSGGRSLPSLRQDSTMEVYVSCVYHPNELYVQVSNHEAILLDKLCTEMTEHYRKNWAPCEVSKFQVGDIVAAKFIDDRAYRAKILSLGSGSTEVLYVDYGDKRLCKVTDLQPLKAEFLKLRFQAILATLNLECLDEKWSDEAINTTYHLTKCAKWINMKAKVLGYYLKDASDANREQHMIWIELYDEEDNNIADMLIRQGLAGLKVDQPEPPVAVAPIIISNPNNALGTSLTSPNKRELENDVSSATGVPVGILVEL